MPSASDHLWAKTLSFGQHMVFVASETSFCHDCTYYIAIHSITVGDEYELRVTGLGSYAVLLNEQYVYGQVAETEYMFYETFVDVALNFTARLEACTGNADLYMSQDTYQPSRYSYTWRSENTNANDQVTINDESLNQIGFYIGVYGEGAGNNAYRLTVHTQSDHAYDRDFPKPGNNGAIEVHTTRNGIEVTFANAVSPTGQALTYRAYFSPADSNVVMYSMCGLDYAFVSDSVSGDESGTTTILLSTDIHSIEPGLNYKINVAAIDADERYGIYESSTMEVIGIVGSAWWVWLVLILVIILVITVLFLVFRNRRLTQELEVEMGDIPKAVVRKAVNGPGNKGKINYAQLLAETEDEGDYEPPPI